MALNQYDRGSADNGPNAHKKGNRTNSRRDTTAIQAYTKKESEDISKYKEAAERRRQKRKYRQEDLFGIIERINAYIDRQGREGRPFTVAGLIRAAQVSKSTWYEMLAGDYDYRLIEYADRHGIDLDTLPANTTTTITDTEGREVVLIAYSEALQKAMLAIEEQTEERLYSKGRVGDIFSLKAVHGWQEERTPQTVNQTLIIGESDARKAIEALEKARLP